MRYATHEPDNDNTAPDSWGRGVGGMKVYIAFELYPYEGQDIIGVYATQGDAEAARDDRKSKDKTNGYNEFYIEEYEVE